MAFHTTIRRKYEMNQQIFTGTFVHATDSDPHVILEGRSLGVKNGQIVFLDEVHKLPDLVIKHGMTECIVQELTEGQFIMPGLVDTHVHASQFPNIGTGMDLGLMEWLQKYTFPIEAKYKDVDYAKCAYQRAVTNLLKNGTTTACYFATIHKDSAMVLSDIIANAGQRAYVGKVNMDQNSPDYYVESLDTSVTDTETFIEEVIKKNYPLVIPIITPRFAPTCSRELMRQLGDLAKKHNLPIQTHLSESKGECEFVRELFPECAFYVDVYRQSGLLTSRSIMAHCIHLSDDELEMIKEADAGIAHCPNSNLTLRSGILDVKRIMNAGIKVGLGTDISGGYGVSVLDAIRRAVDVSNVLAIEDPEYQAITHREAFMMATLGGSKVLGLDEKIGNFIVGKDFDALVVDVSERMFPQHTINDLVQVFLFNGDDRNIKQVYVAGKLVMEN